MPRHTRTERRFSRAAAAALLAAALATPCAAQDDKAPKTIDLMQNAALYYWKAAGIMQTPGSPEDFAMIPFVERDVELLPPRIFASHPDALKWLLNERPMINALDHGARRPACAFPIYVEGEASLDLGHLPKMRAVARRALAVAKAFEHADNAEGAAIVYANLLRLVQHLDQDESVTSGVAAADILQRVIEQLMGFLSRGQRAQAISVLARFFAASPENIFHPGDYLRFEARRYGEWLLSSSDRAEERLNRLYGNATYKPGVEILLSLPQAEREARLRNWVDDYRHRIRAIAEALDSPYASGIAQIRELDQQKTAMRAGGTPDANPLIPLLVPTANSLYQRFLLAEAQFDAADVLCAAALFRAETGDWPADLPAISVLTQRVFAKDPFSGDELFYKLSSGMPTVTIRVPKWMASQPAYLYTLNLSKRLKDESNRLEDTLQKISEERQKRAEIEAKAKILEMQAAEEGAAPREKSPSRRKRP
jgi:glutathione S-transferase